MKELFEKLAERMLRHSGGMTIGMDTTPQVKSNITTDPVRQSLALQAANKKLHDAISSGDATLVKQLIELGADLNIKDSGGKTALQYAIEMGHIDICPLLSKQADSVAQGREQQRISTAHSARTKNIYLRNRKPRR